MIRAYVLLMALFSNQFQQILHDTVEFNYVYKKYMKMEGVKGNTKEKHQENTPRKTTRKSIKKHQGKAPRKTQYTIQ